MQQLPKLERLEQQPIDATIGAIQNVAEPLRESPAMRVLADIVRSDEVMFDKVAEFTARRADFGMNYSRPGRNVAPWFAAVARNNPDLLDTALYVHFADKSAETHDKLRTDAQEAGYSYWPSMVIGSGPQSQIFVSALGLERPELAKHTLVVDAAQTVGGTFRSADGMNFRLNSRTRVQTGDRPIPGTRSNLNTLAPGVMTLGDTTTDTYTSANDLGRTVRINHALNNSDFGLGLNLVRIVPDSPAEPSQLKGSISVVLKDASGNEYTVRTDALTAASGIGEPDLDRFSEDTKRYITEQRKVMEEGGAPKVVLYQDLYKYLQDKTFPFKDVKRVAIVGGGDSARTAIGTILGYEPRQDDSVIQVDRVEKLDWYGVRTSDDRRFVENTRLRYAQLALELPRNGAPRDRVNRITTTDDFVNTITEQNQTGKPIVRGEAYDLVVLTTGFNNVGDTWLLQKVAEPLTVTSSRVQNALGTTEPGDMLKTGDVIEFPKGFSVERLQILRAFEQDGMPMYTVCVQAADGSNVVGQLAGAQNSSYPSLAEYCSINNFVQAAPDNVEIAEAQPEQEKEQKPEQKPEQKVVQPIVYNDKEFLEKSQKEKLAILNKNAFIFFGDAVLEEPLENESAYRVVKATKTIMTLELYALDTKKDGENAFMNFGNEQIKIKTAEFEAILGNLGIFEDATIVTDLLREDNDTNAVSYDAQELARLLRSRSFLNVLADNNAIVQFKEGINQWALITKDADGDVLVLLASANFGSYDWTFNEANLSALIDDLEENFGETSITTTVNIQELLQESAKEKKITASEGPYVVATYEDYDELTDLEKQQFLQVGTVISADGEDTDYNAYVVVTAEPNANRVTWQPCKLDVQSDGEISLRVVDEFVEVTSYNRFASTLGLNGDSISITNGLSTGKLEDINGEVLRLSKEAIIDRLEEFYNTGAILIDSRKRGFLNLVSLFKDKNGVQNVAFINSEGYYGLDRSFDRLDAARLRRLATENEWDTVVLPNKPNPGSAIKYAKRLPARQVRTVTNEVGDPLAKQIDGLPVYLIGAAAGLRIAEDVTRLIPNIPENSVGIFVSQPRVVQIAGRTAITSGRIDRQVAPEVEAPEAVEPSTEQMVAKLLLRMGGEPMTAPTETKIANTYDATVLPKSALRLSAEELLKFGLGVRARSLGKKSELRQLLDVYDMRLSYADAEQDTLHIIATKNQAIVLTEDDFTLLFEGNPYALHAVNRILKQQGVNEIGLRLNFDSRGLQVDTIELRIERSKRPRRAPKMPIPRS